MSEPISIALLVADLVGIFVFALSGGVLAVRHRLDLFGVLVLACATAVTGVTRCGLPMSTGSNVHSEPAYWRVNGCAGAEDPGPANSTPI